jgi:hypothetical protein
MAVANDCDHSGHARELLWSALSVTARHDDSGRGIPAMRTADKGAGGAVSFGRYTARVHDDNIGGERSSLGKRAQMSGDGLAVRACCAASEVFDNESRHRLSLWDSQQPSDSPGT